MKLLTKVIFELLRLIFKSKRDLILENLALRQQLAVQQRSIKRPKICADCDMFVKALTLPGIARPETVNIQFSMNKFEFNFLESMEFRCYFNFLRRTGASVRGSVRAGWLVGCRANPPISCFQIAQTT